MTCLASEQNRQPFPEKGTLSVNSNASLGTLRRDIGSEPTVAYCYVVDTIKNEGGRLVQRGSGPNFQGGVVTLCTCKHRMRTALSPQDWEGKWVAGFTGVGAGGGRNALAYLIRVGHAFESHHDLWYSGVLPPETKRAKSATSNTLGDLFEPVDESSDPFDYRGYRPPHEAHPHAPNNAWHGDVDRTGFRGRRAALLVGDSERAHLWERPVVFFPDSIGRGYRKFALGDLISRLETD